MDIKDRGTKKWTSLMLPEHVAMLRNVDWDSHRVAKPILDEYELREIDERIKAAQEFKLPLVIELWRGGLFEEVEGVIEKVDEINKLIWIVDRTGDLHKINYDSVTAVEFAED